MSLGVLQDGELLKTKECNYLRQRALEASHECASTSQSYSCCSLHDSAAGPAERLQETDQLESDVSNGKHHTWTTHPDTCGDSAFDHGSDCSRFKFRRRNEVEMSATYSCCFSVQPSFITLVAQHLVSLSLLDCTVMA